MTLRPGTRADVRAAAAVFGRSFHTTPQWEWLIPDERARAGVLPAFFRSSFGHVRRHGRLMVAVDDADTVVGAIAWSAPGQWKTPAWRGVLAAPARRPGEWAPLSSGRASTSRIPRGSPPTSSAWRSSSRTTNASVSPSPGASSPVRWVCGGR